MTTAVSSDLASLRQDGPSSLVLAAAEGDADAFGLLYERYSKTVYNMALRSLGNAEMAKDVCQECWVVAYKELPKLRNPEAFAPWICRITARACLRAARLRKREAEALPASEEEPSHKVDPESVTIQKERTSLMWQALAALPTRQHLALYLREVDGRTYREIAEIIGTSESAVETLLFRARHGFRERHQDVEVMNTRERCGRARQAIAALTDGEGSAVQRVAVRAHVDGCISCREELRLAQRERVVYKRLALAPVPSVLSKRIFEAAGLQLSNGTAVATIAKLATLAVAKTKMLVVVAATTSGLTAATVVGVSDRGLSLIDSPASVFDVPSLPGQSANNVIKGGGPLRETNRSVSVDTDGERRAAFEGSSAAGPEDSGPAATSNSPHGALNGSTEGASSALSTSPVTGVLASVGADLGLDSDSETNVTSSQAAVSSTTGVTNDTSVSTGGVSSTTGVTNNTSVSQAAVSSTTDVTNDTSVSTGGVNSTTGVTNDTSVSAGGVSSSTTGVTNDTSVSTGGVSSTSTSSSTTTGITGTSLTLP